MARTAAAKKQTPPVHQDIFIDKVDVDRITEFLKTHGKEVEVPAGANEKIALIDAYQELIAELKKGGMEQFLKCDACGGLSDPNLPECPVCGEGGGPGDEAVVEAQAEVVSSDEGPQEETSIEPVGEDAIVPQGTLEDLDAAVSRAKGFITQSMTASWELGHELTNIRTKGIYKLRVNEDGSPIYSDFASWAQAEIGITPRYSNSLQALSTAFSKEEFEAIGPAKLTVIHQAKLPAEDRQRLLESARQGTSFKDVKLEIEKLLPPERKKPEGSGAKPPGERPSASSVPEPTEAGGRDNAITVTFQKGTVELRMQTKGKDHIKEAHQDFINGVTASYTHDLKTGILTIKYKRVAT